MTDEINFLDLTSLKRINDTTVVEKFGGLINSSFFDASNILGTLKLKGLIDFTTAVPGQNAIKVTEHGKQLVAEAAEKAKLPFDPLDLSILTQLSAGKRTLNDLHSATNISPHDLAMHLNKLTEQQFATVDIRNGALSVTLTEKGFMQVKEGMPKPPEPPKSAPPQFQPPMAAPGAPAAPAAQASSLPQSSQPTAGPTPTTVQRMPSQVPHPNTVPGAPQQPVQPQQAPQPGQPEMSAQNGNNIAELEKELKMSKGKKTKKMAIVVIAIVLILLLVVLFQRGII